MKLKKSDSTYHHFLKKKRTFSSLSIASFLLGVIALVMLFFFPVIISFPLALASSVTGIIALNRKKTFAFLGFITGSMTIVFLPIALLFFGVYRYPSYMHYNLSTNYYLYHALTETNSKKDYDSLIKNLYKFDLYQLEFSSLPYAAFNDYTSPFLVSYRLKTEAQNILNGKASNFHSKELLYKISKIQNELSLEGISLNYTDYETEANKKNKLKVLDDQVSFIQNSSFELTQLEIDNYQKNLTKIIKKASYIPVNSSEKKYYQSDILNISAEDISTVDFLAFTCVIKDITDIDATSQLIYADQIVGCCDASFLFVNNRTGLYTILNNETLKEGDVVEIYGATFQKSQSHQEVQSINVYFAQKI